ncbi:MAG: hypothetical protein P8Y44_09710, partial [Acidobacteriota bacterium]
TENLTGLTPTAAELQEDHAFAGSSAAERRSLREAGGDQLRLIGVFVTVPLLLFLSTLTLVSLMSLLALPLVPLGIFETLSLVSLGPLLLSLFTGHESPLSSPPQLDPVPESAPAPC